MTYDNLDETRRGYLNFIGSDLGVQGAQRVDHGQSGLRPGRVSAAAVGSLSDRWRAMAGVRNSVVVVTSDNHFASCGDQPRERQSIHRGQSGRGPDLSGHGDGQCLWLVW
jgi:hypothetical protein